MYQTASLLLQAMVVCTILFMLKAKFISIPAHQKHELKQSKALVDKTKFDTDKGKTYLIINRTNKWFWIKSW